MGGRQVVKAVLGFTVMALPLIAFGRNGIETLTAEDCKNYPGLIPKNSSKQDQAGAIEASTSLARSSLLRYLGDKDSVFSDYYDSLRKRKESGAEVLYNPEIAQVKLGIQSEDQKKYIRGFSEYFEKIDKPVVNKYFSKNSPYADFVRVSSGCLIKGVAEQKESGLNSVARGFVQHSMNKVRSATVGYFNANIKSCTTSDKVGTGNPYSEPKQWPGSRFVVIDVLFKNEDSEGRLPVAGSLIINYKGRELRYDNTESVLLDGYGIYFKSVNPLVSMPTKIVYRIPDEVSGEVSWEPGRNVDKTKLWCTFILPKA